MSPDDPTGETPPASEPETPPAPPPAPSSPASSPASAPASAPAPPSSPASSSPPAGDTLPPVSGARVDWDEQPTVNLTGEDLAQLAFEPLADTLDDHTPPAHEPEIEQARELTRSHLSGLLEALVFASDKPMKDREIARLASAPVKQVRELLAELKASYAQRGIVLDEIAGGWLFRTSAQYAPFVRELSAERPVRLSRAQVETLAIVAYRQPVTRPEIDDIRGVDSGATLKLLAERELIRILGKKDEPGRPLLYGTTTAFLEFFGLKSLKDLPTLREFTELSDESRRVAEAELGDVLPEAAGSVEPTIAPPESVEHDTLPPPPVDPARASQPALEDSDETMTDASPPAPSAPQPVGSRPAPSEPEGDAAESHDEDEGPVGDAD